MTRELPGPKPRVPREKRPTPKSIDTRAAAQAADGWTGPDLTQRADRALGELRKLCHALAEEMGLPKHADLPFSTLDLALQVDLRRQRAERSDEECAEALLATLERQIAERLSATSARVPGHVYCFQCGTPRCVHSLPPAPDHVFSGYTATGKPTWETLLNLGLRLGDTRVDQIFAANPSPLAIVLPASELSSELLPSFGGDGTVFRLLGQIAFGLLPGALRGDTEGARFAFSVQIAETQTASSPWHLVLNIVGLALTDLGAHAEGAPWQTEAEALRLSLREAQRRTDALARRTRTSRRRREPFDLRTAVASLLTQLRADLERIFASTQRKTQHAQQRHASGERPTGQATSDALATPAERILADRRRGTLVVLGPKGRVHIFSAEAKLVTSLVLGKAEVERRLQSARWAPASREQCVAFAERLRAGTSDNGVA